MSHSDQKAAPWSSRPCGDKLAIAFWFRSRRACGHVPVTWFLFCLVVFRVLGPCRMCRRWSTVLLGVFERGVVCACVVGLVLVTSQLCRFYGGRPASSPFTWCLALEGLSRSERLSPFPGTPILVSLLRVAPGYERARVGSPREQTLELRGKQDGQQR
ncbi:hypothetical protein Taro_015671 [Colocasia esculenta]|uniref:Transmembrane protein n=1 Tax=Colocasia esculenta TaxID=4460 RepID=A0A843ULG0_COLES|nr:hypothetical protein [Colocasia esculenta]